MLLSVIIPIGNLERDIENLYKIIDHVPKSLVEVIFVLDDDKKMLEVNLRNYLAHVYVANFKLIKSNARNPGGSRNLGVACAESEWIVFCDSDDLPNIENMLQEIKKDNYKSDVLIGSFEFENIRRKFVHERYFGNDSNQNWEEIAINPGIWRWVIKRELALNLEFPKLSMGEDQLFILNLLAKNPIIKFSNELFYRYRLGSPGSLTSTKQNLGDLVKILEFEFKWFNIDFHHKRVKSYFIIRQILTLLRHGNLRLKIKSLIFLCLFVYKSPLSEFSHGRRFTVKLLRNFVNL
jgi:glycosyltransferase involved in cell wall biosynthesis